MLRWTLVVLVVCFALGAAGLKRTSCDCGNVNKKGRIVGGSQALPHEYPWMVMLVTGYLSRFVLCGGTIVTPTVVITAAHCTRPLSSSEPLHIIAGSSDVKRPDQVVAVVRRLEHEGYYMPPNNVAGTINDISLLFLERPLRFNQFVGPICMLNGKLNLENKWTTVTGWGKVGGHQGFTEQLKKTNLKVQPFRNCQTWYGQQFPHTQLCTQADGTTICKGDSGGPLSYLDPETNRYTLVGLVSLGSPACSPGSASVFTDVSAYLPWIKSKINTLGCQKIG